MERRQRRYRDHLEVNGTKSVFASFVLNEYQLTHIGIGGR